MEQEKKVQIGLLGLGTVGTGIMKTLLQNGTVLQVRTGVKIEVPHILVRSLEKERGIPLPPGQLTTDADQILENPEISVVIEVMGGMEPAKTLILKAIHAGKHVITANKELLAKYGSELFTAADKAGVQLLFEASVAGGIPVIRFLQGYLTANQVQRISGILNGTSNYILTRMDQAGLPFAEVLSEAQRLGYAEADPTNDIEGIDAAYKLAILANLAYEIKVPVQAINCRGISMIELEDLQLARKFGGAIKLVASAAKSSAGIELSVAPQFLPAAHPLARIDDVFNAVMISSDVVGDLTFIGKGAGEYPTASAVLEDLTALLRQQGNVLRPAAWNSAITPSHQQEFETRYIRIRMPREQVETIVKAAVQFFSDQGHLVTEDALIAAADAAVWGCLVEGLTQAEWEQFIDFINLLGIPDKAVLSLASPINFSQNTSGPVPIESYKPCNILDTIEV